MFIIYGRVFQTALDTVLKTVGVEMLGGRHLTLSPKGNFMSEEEVIETQCKNCDKECNKGIVQRIDGTYHCA